MTGKKIYLCFILILAFALGKVIAQKSMYKTERIPLITEGSADVYAPVKYKNGIVFISNRKRGVIDNYQFKDETGDYYSCYNYYYSKIDPSDGSLSIPELFDVDLTTRSNKGPLAFSADEQTMYFTKNLLEPKRLTGNTKDNPVGIFVAHFNGVHWTDIKPFPYCTGQYNYGHPALSADGKHLYFASDTVGGYGGFDLWSSELVNGQWSAPQNMGPTINSSGDEGYPIVHSSGRLYFSSKAAGKSRVQNFYSEYIDQKWTDRTLAPDLLGNQTSVKYFLGDSLLKEGYYVEERNRHMTIRHFKLDFPKFDSIRPIVEPRFCYTFFDKTSLIIDTLTMTYEWTFAGTEKVRKAEAYHCFPAVGSYLIELNVINIKTGELYFSQVKDTFTIADIRQVRIKYSLSEKAQSSPDQTTFNTNQKIYFSTDVSNLKGIKIDQVFWEFGDLDKGTGTTNTHIFRKPGNYKVICHITGTENKKPLTISNFIMIEVKNKSANP